MNSENSETFYRYISLFNLTNKIDLRRGESRFALFAESIVCIYYTWKSIKVQIKTVNFKYQLQPRMINLNYLIDHMLYHIFNIVLSILSKNMKRLLITQQKEHMQIK